ncbi:MAG TPA: hypothetical protein VK151_02850 [Fluviicola sp.]|nr:hypothetical protein [Fluviicola sp.]
MGRIKQLHTGIMMLHLGLIFAGFAFGDHPITFNVISYGVVLFLLRIKFWWDDEQYFLDVENGKLEGGIAFKIGVALAVISWIIWCFVFLFIRNLELSFFLMFVFFIPSTFWIVAAMAKKGAYSEQIPWLFFNIIYMAIFLLLYFRNEVNMFDNIEHFTTGLLAILFLTFLFDLGITRILEAKRNET